MLYTSFTNIRDIQRNYRKVAKEVNETDKPVIVMSSNQPQFAIVSLKTLQDLEQKKQPSTIQALKEIARWAGDNHVSAPADLSENHNEYAWGQ